MTPSRRTFGFVFTATLAAVFLIVTGLMGYQPPAQLSLDPATWRRGLWTGDVIGSQLALGGALLIAAVVVGMSIKRR